MNSADQYAYKAQELVKKGQKTLKGNINVIDRVIFW